MSNRVVFDVNVLVSAALAPGGIPARAIAAAVKRHWTIIGLLHTTNELAEVLDRPRFDGRLTNTDLNTFLTGYRQVSTDVEPDLSVTGVADDEEDDRVLGTAVAGRADIVVTGDKGMLAIGSFVGIPIVTARTLLDVINS